jgi:hypothetical protein
VGSANVTVTATGGGVTRTLVIRLTVQAGLSLTAAPATLSIPQSGSGQVVLTVSTANLFTTAGVYVTGVPVGVAVAGGPATANSMTIIFNASSTAATGTHTVSFTMTAAGVTKTATVALTIAPSLFTVSENSSALTVASGASGNLAVTVTSASAFTSAVALTVSGLPAGVSAVFSPASVSGAGAHSSTLHITVASGTRAGSASAVISASGGGTTMTLPLALTISGS